MFRWAVSEEIVPSSVYEALQTAEGLKKGRTNARETTPIPPDTVRADPILDQSLFILGEQQ